MQNCREDRVNDTEPARIDDAPAAGTLEGGGPGHLGHRDRLRTRFLTAGADALQDYELLELLLFAAMIFATLSAWEVICSWR